VELNYNPDWGQGFDFLLTSIQDVQLRCEVVSGSTILAALEYPVAGLLTEGCLTAVLPLDEEDHLGTGGSLGLQLMLGALLP